MDEYLIANQVPMCIINVLKEIQIDQRD